MSDKKNENFSLVKKILVEVLKLEEDKITLESRIVTDLGAESLDILTLLIELEDKLNKHIPDEEAQKLVTVKDIVEYIS